MSDILCCIFNHNSHEAAARWAGVFKGHFPTCILDSGSTPPCPHPLAVTLDNIFYSGLLNEAWKRAVEGSFKWVVIVTSDVQISAPMAEKLVEAMKFLIPSTNVGLYQPSTSWKGRSLPQSRCHFSGKMRSASFQEGWFHMVRTDLLGKICPIDTSVNLLGWGTDLALCHFARIEKKLILVDDRVRVLHPSGTGYNREEAKRQMTAWHATIPGYTSPRHFRPLKAKIEFSQ